MFVVPSILSTGIALQVTSKVKKTRRSEGESCRLTEFRIDLLGALVDAALLDPTEGTAGEASRGNNYLISRLSAVYLH